MPLHVRAGAILPLGPVRQYVDEPVDGPLTLVVYPGADGAFTLYEDDGRDVRLPPRRMDGDGDHLGRPIASPDITFGGWLTHAGAAAT